MKKHFIELAHQPKKVLTLSIIIALIIGIFGYNRIHTIPNIQPIKNNSEVISNETSSQKLTLGFLSGGRIKSVLVKANDQVKKGAVLATLDAGNAAGVLMEAKAAYITAEASYQKIINGATGTTIDVVKAAVNTAQINLDQITKQQDTLVENAYRNLLNSNIAATSNTLSNTDTPPTITGIYTGGKEGTFKINLYGCVNNSSCFNAYNQEGNYIGNGVASNTNPQPVGDTGLFIKFTNNYPTLDDWFINIPNKNASNYLTNYNAYQSALQTKNQTIAVAKATLDQANASLAAAVTAARPEDVSISQAQVDNASGALKIAEAAYEATIITAPADGTVTAVSITPGQIASPNAPAIEFLTSLTVNN